MSKLKFLLIAWLFPATLLLANENDLDEIRAVEKKIQTVAARNMEACVAITDGVGFGSGVIVSREGLILTAGHVLGSNTAGREFEVIFPGGRTARAVALGKNLNVDAGMLQLVDSGPWPFVKLSRETPEPGDWTVGLGHSGGYELGRKPPVRSGRVLELRGEQVVTDAVLIGGDSGGPLFNLAGELIAIHSSIGDTVAENRHMSIATYRTHWQRMRRGETWGQLPELSGKPDSNKKSSPRKPAPKLGVVVDRGADVAKVTEVRSNSPAERVGIQQGDIVTSFDGQPVNGPEHLIELVKSRDVGDTVALVIQRNGQELHYQIILDVLTR